MRPVCVPYLSCVDRQAVKKKKRGLRKTRVAPIDSFTHGVFGLWDGLLSVNGTDEGFVQLEHGKGFTALKYTLLSRSVDIQ